MHHIGGKEAVVAQLVEHNLIRWKVVAHAWALRHDAVYGKQQRGFAQLVAMGAVGKVAHRTYGERDVDVGIEFADVVD